MIRVNFTNIMLSKRSKTKENLRKVILFIYGSKIGKVKLYCHGWKPYRKQTWGLPLGEKRARHEKGVHGELLGHQQLAFLDSSAGCPGVCFINNAHVCFKHFAYMHVISSH